MRSLASFALVVLAATCGPSPNARLPGSGSNEGGAAASLGGATTSASGGTITAMGGIAAAGGATTNPSAGGRPATGGIAAAGGASTSIPSSGGRSSAGGRSATGGSVAMGGRTATGGAVAAGGTTGSTTVPDAGGSTAKLDAATLPSSDGGNCISAVIGNGYSCGSAAPCSACNSNGTSLELKCQSALKCIEAKWPCSNNCLTECYNSVGADGVVQSCVAALQTAACTGPGC